MEVTVRLSDLLWIPIGAMISLAIYEFAASEYTTAAVSAVAAFAFYWWSRTLEQVEELQHDNNVLASVLHQAQNQQKEDEENE